MFARKRINMLEEKYEELSRQCKIMQKTLFVIERVVDSIEAKNKHIQEDLLNLKNQLMEEKDDHK